MMTPTDLWNALGAWQKASPYAGLYVAGGFGAVLLAAQLWGKKRQPQTTHGTSRWASPAEIRDAGLTVPQGVVCARLGRQLLCDDSETHVLLVAPSRSGKGIGPIICSLLTWQQSCLVYDPANGENYAATHHWRESLGHRVERFTPRDAPRACINVCDLIRFGTPEELEDCMVVGDSLTSPLKLHQSDAGRYFRGLAKMVIAAGLLHLHYTAPPVSLGKLGVFLTQGYPTLGKCLEAMRTSRHTTHGVHPSVAWLVQATSQLGDRSTGDAWGTVVSALLPYADSLTRRSTDTSTICVDDLQHSATPMSLYLAAPSTRSLETLAPVYRVVSDMIQYRLQQSAPRSAKQRLLVIADEAPAFGYSSFLDKGAAEAGKYGIKLLIVAQDTVQIDGTFGKENSIFGNTATKIFYAPDRHETAKALSQAWGQATVEQPVLSKQEGIGGKTSVSYQQVGQWHMAPDQLRTMHPQACVIDRTGLYPILAGKVNCRHDPEFRGKYQTSAV
ncbi:MAG TPA: type IV secretory system conjugative DNA transfer family protein [Candidatus Saccharimonadia bacterium]|nr:type IV secretory system conjugative DNA transfer family protein [Candidatus Saccharimonadia bacterium]